MNRSSIIFLQTLVVVIGITVLFLLIIEPQLEGRNDHATLFEIYFQDPFLAYVYIGSTPFFIALYQAFKVLSNCRKNNVFSPDNVKALRTIKFCAIAVICFAIGAEFFIMFSNSDDDRAGGVFMGVFVIFGSIVIATAAAVFERILQKAVDIKSENDFTV